MHKLLHERFGLHHLTVQIEPRGFKELDCVALADETAFSRRGTEETGGTLHRSGS